MLSTPARPEIDHRTIKLVVGVIALALPFLTWALAGHEITSISASYYETGPSQSVFIGFLFAIASFLLGYNGRSQGEMIFSKVAAVAAICIVLLPCDCDGRPGSTERYHYLSAATMFAILIFFCYGFFRRAREKGHAQGRHRAIVYLSCAIVMALSILTIGGDVLSNGALSARLGSLLTFWGETLALVAFGISWLLASHVVPVLTRQEERFSPFRDANPP